MVELKGKSASIFEEQISKSLNPNQQRILKEACDLYDKALETRIWELTEAELIKHKQAHPTRLITFDEVHAIVTKVFAEYGRL